MSSEQNASIRTPAEGPSGPSPAGEPHEPVREDAAAGGAMDGTPEKVRAAEEARGDAVPRDLTADADVPERYQDMPEDRVGG